MTLMLFSYDLALSVFFVRGCL